MNLLIIQARMGSTRLPGKVLMSIEGKAILQHLIDRIKPSRKVDHIIVATTTHPEDDTIEKFCHENKIECSRGSDWDVLDRYYQAARRYKPGTVIRVTSDCPLNTYKVVDFVIAAFEKSNKDYYSNSNHEPDFLEDGFDVEVFRFTALETAWKEANRMSEREHVTPYIKNSGKFSCDWKKYSPDYQFKLSVDSAADFRAVSEIFAELRSYPNFGMEEVLELLKRKPHIIELNHDSQINSGYNKSLKEDRNVNE